MNYLISISCVFNCCQVYGLGCKEKYIEKTGHLAQFADVEQNGGLKNSK